MAAAAVGAITDAHGGLNYRDREYDAAFYLLVIVGVPVWLAFRGCFHVVPVGRLPRGERLDRLRRFAQEHVGWSAIQAALPPGLLLIPLRTTRALRWAARLYWLLAVSAMGSALFVMIGSIMCWMPRPVNAEDVRWLVGIGAFAAPFPFALAAYLYLRRPSTRQAALRGVVAGCLGPLTDPAGWAPELVGRVARSFAADAPDAGSLLRAAERLRGEKNFAHALVVARLALGMATPEDRDAVAERAEALTDECLFDLAESAHQ
jgi:hypothetical protein